MSLTVVACGTCSKEISTMASACPNCGAPNNWVHPKLQFFYDHKDMTGMPVKFEFTYTKTTLAGYTEPKFSWWMWLIVIFCAVPGLSFGFIAALIIGPMAYYVLLQMYGKKKTFEIDFISDTWQSSDDAFWAPIKNLLLDQQPIDSTDKGIEKNTTNENLQPLEKTSLNSIFYLLTGLIAIVFGAISFANTKYQNTNQSKSTDIKSSQKTEDLSALYAKEFAEQLNIKKYLSTADESKIEPYAPVKNNEYIKSENASENTCLSDKFALFNKRRSIQLERYKKEASLRGDAFAYPDQNALTLLTEEVTKSATRNCTLEAEALLSGKPSFDCARVTRSDEKIICENSSLASQDVKLNNAYRAALFFSADKETLKAQLRNWIELRRLCRDASCVRQLYNEQYLFLNSVMD